MIDSGAGLQALPRPLVKTLAIVGLGLIGGSLALAARQAGLAQRIVGFAHRSETAARAQALGLVDQASSDPAVVAGADLLILAVPVASIARALKPLLPYLPSTVVISDGGSTKEGVVQMVRDVLLTEQAQGLRSGAGSIGVGRFVGAHPIAGSHKSGPDAADVSLYQGKRVILTPGADTDADATALVTALWQGVGAKVSQMRPDEHDRLLAGVSHLPHLVAFAAVGALLHADDGEQAMSQAGSGFRDFTRIAASDPQMWADIFVDNADPVLKRLDELEAELRSLRAQVASRDHAGLKQYFEQVRQAREAWGQAQGR